MQMPGKLLSLPAADEGIQDQLCSMALMNIYMGRETMRELAGGVE